MRAVQILIVEDEKLIRVGIHKMLEEYFAERPDLCYNIFEAGNGREGYRKCMEGNIDILITDIKMPSMSGVSLVKRIVSDQLPIHLLAISGYQDYEYVRDMMKLGAYDYLLKPISKKQLFEAMNYFVQNLSPGQSVKSDSMKMEQRLIEALFLEEGEKSAELNIFLQERQVTPEMPCEVIALSSAAKASNSDMELYYLILSFCIQYEEVTVIQGRLDFWMVVCIYRNSKQGEEATRELLRYVYEAGYNVCGTKKADRLSELYNLHLKLHGTFFDLPASRLPEDFSLQTTMDQISACLLEGGREEDLQRSVRAVFDYYQLNQITRSRIQSDFSALTYSMMHKSPDMIEFISKTKFTRYDITDHFDDVSSLTELCTYMQEAMRYLLEKVRRRKESRIDANVAKAVAYIDAHYAADVTLQGVAEHVHLHPNYLSALFAQKIGCTFRGYLRKIRIERAKQYLLEGDFPVSKISELVGYGDTAHFIRAFKKVTGMTPRMYARLGSEQLRK